MAPEVVIISHTNVTWPGARDLRVAETGWLLAITRNPLRDAASRLIEEGFDPAATLVIRDCFSSSADLIFAISASFGSRLLTPRLLSIFAAPKSSFDVPSPPIGAAGGKLYFLPKYSPDLSPDRTGLRQTRTSLAKSRRANRRSHLHSRQQIPRILYARGMRQLFQKFRLCLT
jgi:hypothetical protein